MDTQKGITMNNNRTVEFLSRILDREQTVNEFGNLSKHTNLSSEEDIKREIRQGIKKLRRFRERKKQEQEFEEDMAQARTLLEKFQTVFHDNPDILLTTNEINENRRIIQSKGIVLEKTKTQHNPKFSIEMIPHFTEFHNNNIGKTKNQYDLNPLDIQERRRKEKEQEEKTITYGDYIEYKDTIEELEPIILPIQE